MQNKKMRGSQALFKDDEEIPDACKNYEKQILETTK
jgi:hypothetical protein